MPVNVVIGIVIKFARKFDIIKISNIDSTSELYISPPSKFLIKKIKISDIINTETAKILLIVVKVPIQVPKSFPSDTLLI